jgi:nicotinamidase-related amidase
LFPVHGRPRIFRDWSKIIPPLADPAKSGGDPGDAFKVIAHPSTEIVQPVTSLADAFRRRQLPVVLVTVTGAPPGRTEAPQGNFTPPPDWAELADELLSAAF